MGKQRKRKKEEELPYNELFTDRELKIAIKQQKNTAPGEDTIHPQMIKNLPPETLKYLLDMYNKIWEEGEIPKTWKHATIIPLLKERKDPKDVRSYRPVALTNILCKIFERMVNKRLVWYLEREKNR